MSLALLFLAGVTWPPALLSMFMRLPLGSPDEDALLPLVCSRSTRQNVHLVILLMRAGP